MASYVDLADYASSVLVDSENSIIYRSSSEDDGFKEGSSSDCNNYEGLILDDDQNNIPKLTAEDCDPANLTQVTLSDGSTAYVNLNELNLSQDNAVELEDGSTLLIRDYHYPQFLDGQQIQLADGRVAILHATTERTEGYQPVEMEDGNVAFIALSDLMGEPLDPSSLIICENGNIKPQLSLDGMELADSSEPISEESSPSPSSSSNNNTTEEPSAPSVDESLPNSSTNLSIQDGKLCGDTVAVGHGDIIRIDHDPEHRKSKPPAFLDGYHTLEFSDATFYLPISSDMNVDPKLGSGTPESTVKLTVMDPDFPSSGNELSMRDKTKSIMCPEEGCGKCYTTLHHLKVHQRAHNGERPFLCTIQGCGKAFSTGYGRKAHVRTHTGEKPYKCPAAGCDKSFKTSGDLQKHVRTHTGERPFRCPMADCGRSFTTSNIRKVHYRTHTGEKPYRCPEAGCDRAFASATNYKNHTRIHSGEKPYICTIEGCTKRFTEYSSLYKHHMVHTQQKPYNCNTCNRNYRQASTLTMHKRTAHGIVEADDGTEIILGETVFAFSESAPGGKRLKALGSNFLGYNKKGHKGNILTVQATDGNQDVAGQQFLVLANSAQIAALEHLGPHNSHLVDHDSDYLEEVEEEDDEEEEEEEEDNGLIGVNEDDSDMDSECMLSSL